MPTNILSIINLFEVSRSHFVQDAYVAILGREPDPSGSATYEKMLRTGGNRLRRKIIIDLAKSPEARARNLLLPIIAVEAVHIQRWRFLPWNRSPIASAVAHAESQSLIDEKLPLIEQSIVALAKSIEARLSPIEHRLASIEHTIEGLTKSVESRLGPIEHKLPPIEHAIEALTKSAGKMGSFEEKLPLIEHTMRSLKGVSLALQRLEDRLN